MEQPDHKKSRKKFAEYLAKRDKIKTPHNNDNELKILETKKEISEIKQRLEQIDQVLYDILQHEQSRNAMQRNVRREVNNPINLIPDTELDMRKAEKKEHAEINALRNEVVIIERQLRLLEISAALRIELNDDLKKKRERITYLINSSSTNTMNQ